MTTLCDLVKRVMKGHIIPEDLIESQADRHPITHYAKVVDETPYDPPNPSDIERVEKRRCRASTSRRVRLLLDRYPAKYSDYDINEGIGGLNEDI